MTVQKITALNLKLLTPLDYTKVKTRIEESILGNLKQKPVMDNFKRDSNQKLITIERIVGLIVFLAVLIISANHALNFGRISALQAISHETVSDTMGLRIPDYWQIVLFQIGVIALSEASIMLFSFNVISFKLENDSYKSLDSIFLLMSIMLVIFYNLIGSWGNPLTVFFGIFVPLITVGYGFTEGRHLARYNVEKKLQNKRYLKALSEWELLKNNPTQSDTYQTQLAYGIWDRLYTKNKKMLNQPDGEIDGMFKQDAVNLQLSKEDWNSHLDTDNFTVITIPAAQKKVIIQDEKPDFITGNANPQITKKCTVCNDSFRTRSETQDKCKLHR